MARKTSVFYRFRVLREFFIANRTDIVLIDNFPNPLGVMRIFDTLYAEPDELWLGHHSTPTAGFESMNGTELVRMEFHEDSFLRTFLAVPDAPNAASRL